MSAQTSSVQIVTYYIHLTERQVSHSSSQPRRNTAANCSQTPRPSLTSKLTREHHMKQKIKQLLYVRFKENNWLISRKSYLSIDIKRLLYKTVLEHIWIYGIELWGPATKSNTAYSANQKSYELLRVPSGCLLYTSRCV